MRTLCGLLLIVALGCGGSATPTPEPKAPPPPEPTPAPPPPEPKKDEPKKDEPKTPPPPPVAAWEPDPTKHAVPTAPAAGTLAKAAFAPPEVEFQADTLTFRTIDKDRNPLVTLSVKLLPEQAKAAAGGLKLVVKPDDPAEKVPFVTVVLPPAKAGDMVTEYQHPSGYGLTLDLGKRERGSLAGRVYISLPGDAKDFLAGAFTAEWVRPTNEPPGVDDAPFVQGAVTIAGAKDDTQVRVGYVGTPKGEDFPIDVLPTTFAGKSLSARLDHAKPRVTLYVAAETADKAGRYEHTRLPAGKYLVFATTPAAGPAAKWVTLAADGKLTQDFALDPAKVGKLDVKTPTGASGKVHVVPADAAPVSLEVFATAASMLGLEVDARDGVARFDRLTPGRYEVRLGELSGTIEVRLNETATLELAPPKK